MVFTELRSTLPAAVLFLAAVAFGHAQSHGVGSDAISPRPPEPAAAAQIAITFDDLPAHGTLPPGETRMDVASKIIAALRDADLPPTYGFVNGLPLEQEPANAAVLQGWRAVGYPLGNHSWSHMNLDQHTLEEFELDVSRNEPLLSQWMKSKDKAKDDKGKEKDKGEDWHWFRFPFLAEGDTPAKRSEIRTYLAQHGYKVAAVTMSFADYQWNEPYARCRAKGDDKAIALLESSYFSAADESIGYYRELAHTLYGRDIPYVLLMHIGAFDAEMLPRLLNLYRFRGFQFVTLAEAETDGFYREDTDLHLPPGPDTLEGVMAERHLPLPPHAASAVQVDALCR